MRAGLLALLLLRRWLPVLLLLLPRAAAAAHVLPAIPSQDLQHSVSCGQALLPPLLVVLLLLLQQQEAQPRARLLLLLHLLVPCGPVPRLRMPPGGERQGAQMQAAVPCGGVGRLRLRCLGRCRLLLLPLGRLQLPGAWHGLGEHPQESPLLLLLEQAHHGRQPGRRRQQPPARHPWLPCGVAQGRRGRGGAGGCGVGAAARGEAGGQGRVPGSCFP